MQRHVHDVHASWARRSDSISTAQLHDMASHGRLVNIYTLDIFSADAMRPGILIAFQFNGLCFSEYLISTCLPIVYLKVIKKYHHHWDGLANLPAFVLAAFSALHHLDDVHDNSCSHAPLLSWTRRNARGAVQLPSRQGIIHLRDIRAGYGVYIQPRLNARA